MRRRSPLSAPGRRASLLLLAACSDYEINPDKAPAAPARETAEPEDSAPPPEDSPAPEDTAPPVDTAVTPSGCDCPEGFTALPADDGCTRRTEEEPLFLGDGYPVCPLIPHPDYGSYGARYPGGTVVSDDYWGDNDGVPDGRMNAEGVWACDGDSTTSGYNPVDEWIGFSVCLDITTPGEYLLGLGADNRMRFAVDGVLLFNNTDDNTDNFKYWWIQPITLSSGTHIVEFEGYNAGGPAGLGAEVAGPFPTGSLTDDAAMAGQDYAGNILWSASDSIGSTFALGETSGWSCPDGMALDLCAEAPVCYSEETVDCL
jgi:hypothetical protein